MRLNTLHLRSSLVLLLATASGACSTGTWVKLPENSALIIDERPSHYQQGVLYTRPYSWDTADGIPYRVVDQQANTIRQGRLKSRLRVPAFIWPPAAIAYWPLGFGQRCYDLTEAAPQTCTHEDFRQLRLAERMRR